MAASSKILVRLCAPDLRISLLSAEPRLRSCRAGYKLYFCGYGVYSYFEFP